MKGKRSENVDHIGHTLQHNDLREVALVGVIWTQQRRKTRGFRLRLVQPRRKRAHCSSITTQHRADDRNPRPRQPGRSVALQSPELSSENTHFAAIPTTPHSISDLSARFFAAVRWTPRNALHRVSLQTNLRNRLNQRQHHFPSHSQISSHCSSITHPFIPSC